jgi:hypothetical protein
VPAARLGGQALNHFELQHEVHVLDEAGVFEQVKDEGRGDVVGQVAHHPQRFVARGQRAVVEGEGVGAVEPEVRVDAEGSEEGRGQVPIQLNRVEAAATADQCFCKSAEPRSDLDYVIARIGCD